MWRVVAVDERDGRARLLEVEKVREVVAAEHATALELRGEQSPRQRRPPRPASTQPRERDDQHGVAQRGPGLDVEHALTVPAASSSSGTVARRADAMSAGLGSRRAFRGAHGPPEHDDRRAAYAVAPRREHRVRVDLDLGPLLRGRRDRHRRGHDVGLGVLRGRRDARRARARDQPTVRCGSLVYCVGYRHPAVLANASGDARPPLGRPHHDGARRRLAPRPSSPRTASRSSRCPSGCDARRGDPGASACCSPRTSPTSQGEFYELTRRPLRPEARAGTRSRSGSAAAARR